MNRVLLTITCIAVAACGRSDLEHDFTADPPVKTEPREDPLFVFTEGTGARPTCPRTGLEADLNVATPGDRLVLMTTQPQGECSGAGGEYLVGREADASRHHFFGEHACYFLPQQLRDTRDLQWGVARVTQTAALHEAPHDWCITQLNGASRLTSDTIVRAWAVYPNEKAARAALAALKSQP
jgi:hypothetical protein